jgi:tetratricopeptide (TPR) repeat protein
MKVFLSHSSKDKRIVEQVFQGIGAASCIYDRETFEEGKRSAEEILRGLSRSDIFVLFLSKNSISSQFVISEINFAIEKLFSGQIKSVLIFALDETTYKDLPTNLQCYTVERTNKPAQIVRRIRSRMIELQLERSESSDIFVGREHELRDLQKVLTLPPDEMRPSISIAGWQGLGRRTVMRRALQMIFPYLKREQPSLALEENDSIEDFYRKLYDCTIGMPRTSDDWVRATSEFQDGAYAQRIEKIISLIKTIVDAKEILFLIGDDGLIQSNAEFQPYIRDLLKSLTRTARPQVILIHRRRIPFSRQINYPETSFFSLNSFSSEEAAELLSAHFKQRDIAYTRADLDDLLRFVGGHPENIRIAAEYTRQYGLVQLRKEKSEFTDILVFRSLEILRRIEVSEVAKSLCTALLDFRYLQVDDFLSFVHYSNEEIFQQLRFLEDNGIIERVGKYYRISPYLVDAIARSDFPDGLTEQRRKAGVQMLKRLQEISTFDNVNLSLINSAVLAAIRSGKYKIPGFMAQFLLPSHFLTIAREEYDNGQYARARDLCRESLQQKEKLTIDAQVEAHRLLAIALLRLGDGPSFQETLDALYLYRGKTAKRNYHFLLGFQARLGGRPDDAEQHYRTAYNIDRRNFHVLRELAYVLSRQGRYDEAESFARTAYSIVPTNPFIIDILCAVIIGKERPDQLRDNGQVQKLLHELGALGTDEGKAFFDERKAQFFHKIGEQNEAWEHANRAVDGAPRQLGPRVTRINIALSQGRHAALEEDIRAIENVVSDEANSNRFILDRAKIAFALSKGDVREAKNLLEKAYSLPEYVRAEVTGQIATRVLEKPDVEPALRDWAKKHQTGSGKRRLTRRGRGSESVG